MPCQDGGWPSDSQTNSITIKSLRREINKTESMVCSACRSLEQLGFDFSTNPRLDEWWSKHKSEDLARQLEEAKEKLVKEEALVIAQKPFIELTAEDRAKLRAAGLLS